MQSPRFIRRRRFLLSLASVLLCRDFASRSTGQTTPYKSYRIQKGDTLSELARRYGTTTSVIKQVNGLKSDKIIAGQLLRIPAARDAFEEVSSLTKSLHIPNSRWKFVVAHHSATSHGNASIYAKNHYRRGMRDGLAYHFVIGNGVDSGDGEIEIGSRWRKQLRGGHVKSSIYNEYGIGVCFVGNFMKSRPTRKQIESFHRLMDLLIAEALPRDYLFTVHKLIANENTMCPGRHFPVDQLKKRYAS